MTFDLLLASVLSPIKEKCKYGIYIQGGKNTSTALVASFIEKNFVEFLHTNGKAHISLKGKGYKVAFLSEEARDKAIEKYTNLKHPPYVIKKLLGETFETNLAPVDFYDLPVEHKDFHKVLKLCGKVAYTKISYKKQAKKQPAQSTLTAYFSEMSKDFVELIQKGRTELIEGQRGYFKVLWKNKCKCCSVIGHNEHQCPIKKEKSKKEKKEKVLDKKKVKPKKNPKKDKKIVELELQKSEEEESISVELLDLGEEEEEEDSEGNETIMKLTFWLFKEIKKFQQISSKKDQKTRKKEILEELNTALKHYGMKRSKLEEHLGNTIDKMFQSK